MSYTTPVEVVNQRIDGLRKVWERSFPLAPPNDAVFRTWLSSHSFSTVEHGLEAASQKFCRFEGALTVQDVVKYASKVANSRSKLNILKQKEENHVVKQ